VRGSFLWRNRVLLTSGALLIVSLHLISTGVHPGDLAARPESAFLEIISPVDAAFTRLSDGVSSIATGYLDLVHVREENARLRIELARVNSDRARLTELEVENRHLGELLELGRSLKMEPLVEAHTREEIDRAVAAGARIIGVNNRDLRDFTVRVETSLELIEAIPDECIAVSESGLRTHDDLVRLRRAGFDAFLIGEHLMKDADPASPLRELIGAA